MKRALFSGVLLLAITLQSYAQAPSPAQMGVTSTALPEVLQVLDNSRTWVPVGSVDPTTHTWKPRGGNFDVDQFAGAGVVVGNFVNDDGPVLVAAINAASGVMGGTVVLAAHPYWNQSQAIVVPRGVMLTCAGSFSKTNVGFDYDQQPCTIYQKAGTSLTNNGALINIGVLQDQAHFQPMLNATRAQMEAFVAGFAGTGISITDRVNGTASVVDNVLVGGFAQCIAINGPANVQVRNIMGDCTNGLDISNSHDDNFLNNVEFWEFLTTNRAHTFDNWAISNIADNGAGLWRITTSATNNLTTGERIWIFPGGVFPGGTWNRNAGGLWTVTVIDSTHFDLQGSNSTVTPLTVTGNTTSGLTYIPVPSTANIAVGQNVSGAGVPAGATVGAVWTTPPAISLDQAHAATATATGVALSFTENSYGGGGYAFYDGVWRTGTGFAIGAADGTMCSGCFAFGYNIGYNFRGAVATSFFNSQYDQLAGLGGSAFTPHLNNQNNTSVAIEFTGTSFGNFIKGSLATYSGIGIFNNANTSTSGNSVEVSRLTSTSSWSPFLENATGNLTLMNVQTGNNGQILLNNNAGTPIFVSNRMLGALLYQSAAALPAFYTRNLFGGSIDQAAPSTLTAQRFIAASTVSADVDFYNSAAATDEKYWRWIYSPGLFCLQTANDAYTIPANAMCLTRTGNSPTGLSVNVPITSTASVTTSGGVAAGSTVSSGGTNPVLAWRANGAQPTNQHNWDIAMGVTGNISWRAVSDDQLSASTFLSFTRGSGFSLTGASGAFAVPVLVPSFAIAALPACVAALQGANAFVTNGQASPPYLGAVSTTGAVVAPVFCNGSGWVYH